MTFDELWDKCIAKSNIVWKVYVNPKNGYTILYRSEDPKDYGFQGDSNIPNFSGTNITKCLEQMSEWLDSLY